MDFDRLDARLLGELQKDGRRTVVELAEAIGLSPTPCNRRIKQLEAERVIEGYVAVINPARLGLKVQAFIQVKLAQHADDVIAHFERELDKLEEVIGCYATTGEYDFLLQVVAPDLEELGNIVLKKLMKIPGVRDVHSSIVLDTIKRSLRMPLGHLAV